MKSCFPMLAGAAWLLVSAPAVLAGDLIVELCSKTDPTDRIVGTLVEQTKGQWTIVSRGRRVTVYEGDFGSCPPSPGDEQSVQRQKQALEEERKRRAIEEERRRLGLALPQETEELIMEGSGTVSVGVLPTVIEEYARSIGASVSASNTNELKQAIGPGRYELTASGQSKPFLRIVVKPGGSNSGFSALAAKNAQAGLSSRPYSNGEIEKLLAVSGKKHREEIERVIGLDAIVIIVNPSNRVQSLQLCEIAKLFSGDIRTWQGAGGDARRVTPYVLTASSGTYDLFRSILRENCHVEISPNAVPNTTCEEMITSVAGEPGSIGLAGLAVLSPRVKPLGVKGACGIENAPSRFAVKTEDYPLTRRLFLYAPYPVQKESQRFLDFLPTAAAQAAVGKTQAVDQAIEMAFNPRRASAPIQDAELQQDAQSLGEFERDLRGADRLSISFRFRSNSTELDTKANEDISRLAAYFQRHPTRRSMLIAGFTDAIGPPDANRRLALGRAEVVRRALENVGARLDVGNVQVKGYGEILPVACNDTDVGREKNRRVEIYLRE
jgi:phosphate transport system substrate-binding protein